MGISRNQARQLVSHGHLLLNGRKVTVPSISIKVGDKIEVREKKDSQTLIRRLISENSNRPIPEWLLRDDIACEVTMYPTREMIPTIAEEQQIVELFSK
jgi:small subunit ribosomal protein S4